MSFDPQDAEALRRRMAEAETARAAKDGAPLKPSLGERWRAWRHDRHKERIDAKARSHETLKDYKPPTGDPFLH
jgi:hypothetical protein